MKFDLENQSVTGGVIHDYVKGQQSTAYSNIWLDFSCTRSIRCSVCCGSIVRMVTVSPEMTLSDVVRFAFKVRCSDRVTDQNIHSFSVEDLIADGRIKVDGIVMLPHCIAKDIVHFGSVVTVTPTLSLFPKELEPQIVVSIVLCNNTQKEPESFSITVIISKNYSVQYKLPSDATLKSMKQYFSVLVPSQLHHRILQKQQISTCGLLTPSGQILPRTTTHNLS